MMAAATGTPAAEYAVQFDTVYVSLYKYFGAPFGGLLAGTADFCEGLFHARRMFGGGLSQAWMAAALALRGATASRHGSGRPWPMLARCSPV